MSRPDGEIKTGDDLDHRESICRLYHTLFIFGYILRRTLFGIKSTAERQACQLKAEHQEIRTQTCSMLGMFRYIYTTYTYISLLVKVRIFSSLHPPPPSSFTGNCGRRNEDSPSAENPDLSKVLSRKPAVCQNIALHALTAAGNISLYISSQFIQCN